MHEHIGQKLPVKMILNDRRRVKTEVKVDGPRGNHCQDKQNDTGSDEVEVEVPVSVADGTADKIQYFVHDSE